MYEELRDRNFEIIGVAEDTGGEQTHGQQTCAKQRDQKADDSDLIRRDSRPRKVGGKTCGKRAIQSEGNVAVLAPFGERCQHPPSRFAVSLGCVNIDPVFTSHINGIDLAGF